MDMWLVYTARARATGANVHAVNNLCQIYVSRCEAARRFNGSEDFRQAATLAHQLYAFAKTGKLPAPVPDGVT